MRDLVARECGHYVREALRAPIAQHAFDYPAHPTYATTVSPFVSNGRAPLSMSVEELAAEALRPSHEDRPQSPSYDVEDESHRDRTLNHYCSDIIDATAVPGNRDPLRGIRARAATARTLVAPRNPDAVSGTQTIAAPRSSARLRGARNVAS